MDGSIDVHGCEVILIEEVGSGLAVLDELLPGRGKSEAALLDEVEPTALKGGAAVAAVAATAVTSTTASTSSTTSVASSVFSNSTIGGDVLDQLNEQ